MAGALTSSVSEYQVDVSDEGPAGRGRETSQRTSKAPRVAPVGEQATR